MVSSTFTRVYTPNKSSEFKDQLYNWCDRVHIGHIRFVTSQTAHRDQQGHLLYTAVPIFPGIIVGQAGRVQYDENAPFQVTSQNMIGWGTSKKQAEEMASANLLNSYQYCFY
ncbi:unnamed protein product [Rhizoctonia solani]|uniref:Uncharacterized protein n=1 Tax=Rhizoctonia solani TaxID=456999 RepID=A0A8H3BA42_9AGAM|nr:unnamed protein product [Rhizoctonia solani]CAE6515201.1 unnamed protein product [Rhizoctonia solani]